MAVEGEFFGPVPLSSLKFNPCGRQGRFPLRTSQVAALTELPQFDE